MNLHGYACDESGSLTKVEISVERTDADEVAIFARTEDTELAALYLSVDSAVRVGALLGIAALAHEIQAHEVAKILAREQSS